MFCGKCGKELQEGARFCPVCGAENAQAGAALQIIWKKKKKKWVVALAAVLVIAAVPVLVYNLLAGEWSVEGNTLVVEGDWSAWKPDEWGVPWDDLVGITEVHFDCKLGDSASWIIPDNLGQSVEKITFGAIFDTSKVTDMNGMFWGCESLREMDLSNFDTSKVTDMSGMFGSCGSLTELDLSNFDTSNVQDMSGMFNMFELDVIGGSLVELDLSSFDTSKVTDMGGMFGSCRSLTELDLSNFDTTNVTDMGYMFNDCNSLEELDLSRFDISNETNVEGMFDECNASIIWE